jgi:hypothetical protein
MAHMKRHRRSWNFRLPGAVCAAALNAADRCKGRKDGVTETLDALPDHTMFDDGAARKVGPPGTSHNQPSGDIARGSYHSIRLMSHFGGKLGPG